MEGIRGMFSHWRTYGGGYISHTLMVHLHLLSYNGFTDHSVYDTGLLDEYETVYTAAQAKPA